MEKNPTLDNISSKEVCCNIPSGSKSWAWGSLMGKSLVPHVRLATGPAASPMPPPCWTQEVLTGGLRMNPRLFRDSSLQGKNCRWWQLGHMDLNCVSWSPGAGIHAQVGFPKKQPQNKVLRCWWFVWASGPRNHW